MFGLNFARGGGSDMGIHRGIGERGAGPLHGTEYLGNARMIQGSMRPTGEFDLGFGRVKDKARQESPLERQVSYSFRNVFLAVRASLSSRFLSLDHQLAGRSASHAGPVEIGLLVELE